MLVQWVLEHFDLQLAVTVHDVIDPVVSVIQPIYPGEGSVCRWLTYEENGKNIWS